MNSSAVLSSFRDPSGFLFHHEGELYRQVNLSYSEHYDRLMSSGLYDALVGDGLLIPHTETRLQMARSDSAYKILKPELVRFVSYPYEWCFSQLRDAALATLAIQKRAFEFGMTLKDGSAFNIQFHDGQPVLIDTLSFETYRSGQIWVPYRQFCQHFLAPLALVAKCDARLGRLSRLYVDGVPLDLAASLLPWHTRLSFGLLTHLHVHGRAQVRYADRTVKPKRSLGLTAFQGLVDSLESTVRNLEWHPGRTEWSDYYDETNYGAKGLEDKKAIVAGFLDRTRPAIVWDLGANTGIFSRMAADRNALTVSFDLDPACVDRNYRQCRERGEKRLLPLVLDLNNPSPGIGWAEEERLSLLERGPADTIVALALVHHLAISNNVPLPRLARTFARMGQDLIIEFVDKQDSQVQRLLSTREDVFPDYTQRGFEEAFGENFEIIEARQPRESMRTVYLMRSRQ